MDLESQDQLTEAADVAVESPPQDDHVSRAVYAALVQLATDAIVIADQARRITLFNGGAERIFGYSAEEILGEPLETLLPERFRANHQQHVEAFGRSEIASRLMGEREDVFGLRKDGSEFPAEASVSHLRVDGRQVLTVILRDITARKRAQLMLREQARELAQSNQDLAQFAYVASHDLQEPLRMVSSYLGILADRYKDKHDKDTEELIGFAIDGADRMRDLIDDLLDYSQIGDRTTKVEPIDMKEMVGRLVEKYALSADASKAEIHVDPLPTIRGEAIQLERLIANLVENALKYRSQSAPRIHISAVRKGDAWEFAVADNGIGIDPKFSDKVFDLFTRLHSREQIRGTGIGLASCRRIVERHGGSIWVEPAAGGGSIFRFTIAA